MRDLQPLTTHHLTTLLFLASAALAQSTNTFLLYPDDARGATTFSTRYSFGGLAGEMLQQVPGSNLAGVGDAGGICSVGDMNFVLQDQNSATAENFAVIFRAPTVFGAPDQNPSGIIAQAGPLLSPPGSGGAASFLITVTFAAPVVLPCTGTYFYGVALSAAPGWALGTDGLSIHNAYNAPAGAVGSNARASAPVIAWQIFDPGSGSIVGTASTARVANIGLGTPQTVLSIGNFDPLSQRSLGGIDYGLGGLYPAAKTAGRDDGLEARIAGTQHLGGVAVLLLGLSFGPPTPLPGFAGRVYLNFAGPIVQVGVAPILGTTIGYAKLSIAPPGLLPIAPGVGLFFQAATVDATFANPHLSNGVVVRL